MTLREMTYVSTIAQEGSFSRAASRLFISQSALSQSIARLENELGLTLFARNKSQVQLTASGQILLENAASVLQANAHLNSVLQDLAMQNKEELHVGISLFYGAHHLSRFLNKFLNVYPGVRLTLHEAPSAELENMVVRQEVNLAFVPFPLSNPSLQYDVLYLEEIYIAVPPVHPFSVMVRAHKREDYPYMDLTAFRNEPFISLHNMRFTSLANELCSDAGFTPRIILETQNWDTAHALVKSGLGVSFIPAILVPPRTSDNTPSYFRINSPKAMRRYAAIYLKRNGLSNAAQELIRIARESIMNDAADVF